MMGMDSHSGTISRSDALSPALASMMGAARDNHRVSGLSGGVLSGRRTILTGDCGTASATGSLMAAKHPRAVPQKASELGQKESGDQRGRAQPDDSRGARRAVPARPYSALAITFGC